MRYKVLGLSGIFAVPGKMGREKRTKSQPARHTIDGGKITGWLTNYLNRWLRAFKKGRTCWLGGERPNLDCSLAAVKIFLRQDFRFQPASVVPEERACGQ